MTPRHVKKNINTFATDWELAKQRDNSNTSGKFLTLRPKELAIFTVLRVDYSDFYNKIIERPMLLIDFANGDFIAEEHEDISNIESLVGFLSKVGHIIPDDPRPYFYFNNQKLNPLTGRNDLEVIKKFIMNGQSEEFKKSVSNVNKKDLSFVFNSVISDIISELDIRNVFSILFDHFDVIEYMDNSDRIQLEQLISKNLDIVLKYDIKNILQVFNKCINYESIWKALGEIISNSKSINDIMDLLDAHVELPELVSKLQINNINDIYNDNAIEIADKAEEIYNDIYYIPRILLEIAKDHPLINHINWYSILYESINHYISSVQKSNDGPLTPEQSELVIPDFKFADWIRVYNEKCGSLSVKQINNLIKVYEFNDIEKLYEIPTVWMDAFNIEEDIEELLSLFDIINQNISLIFNEDELERLGELLVPYNGNEEVRDKILKLLEVLNNEDIDSTLGIIHNFKNTDAVAIYAFDNFEFKDDDYNKELLDVLIVNDKKYNDQQLIALVNKATQTVFNPHLTNSAHLVLKMIKESNKYLKLFREHRLKWFNIDADKYLWLNWSGPEEQYIPKLEIYYELFKDEGNIWSKFTVSLKALTSFATQSNSLGKNYRAHLPNFLNSSFHLINAKCNSKDDLIEIIKELTRVTSYGSPNTTLSIFDYLDKNEIDNFLRHASKIIELSNKDLNDLIVKHSELDSSQHLTNVINRWCYFSRTDRIELTSTLPKDREILLYKHIKSNPELKYIDEIDDYALESTKTIREDIMSAIISEADDKLLNEWLVESIKLFDTNGLVNQRIKAIEYIIETRDDVKLTNLPDIEKLFNFRDDRTKIAIKLINRYYPKRDKNKKEFKQGIRKNILLLEDNPEFKELVIESKLKFGWRNTVVS
ncbi:hypothetical protein [Metabacillus niabensis]|uniref:hypothetical protein n=1 Tax=Metabacillus niabensis TaxID=324854 RepID=UPI0039A350CB